MTGKRPKIAVAVLGFAALTIAVLAVVLGGSGSGGGSAPGESSAPVADESAVGGHLTGQPDQMRTVLVSNGREPAPSPPGETLHALRLKGSVPKDGMLATVLTDEDCAPDADGVSHCTNKLRLHGGEMLVVRHPHRMMEVPCLSPGEHVMVRPA